MTRILVSWLFVSFLESDSKPVIVTRKSFKQANDVTCLQRWADSASRRSSSRQGLENFQFLDWARAHGKLGLTGSPGSHLFDNLQNIMHAYPHQQLICWCWNVSHNSKKSFNSVKFFPKKFFATPRSTICIHIRASNWIRSRFFVSFVSVFV